MAFSAALMHVCREIDERHICGAILRVASLEEFGVGGNSGRENGEKQ